MQTWQAILTIAALGLGLVLLYYALDIFAAALSLVLTLIWFPIRALAGWLSRGH